MAMENSFTPREKSTMECGGMTKPMAKEFTFIPTEPNIREGGTRTCSMVLARNSGQIHPNSPDGIKRAGRMG